MQIGGLIHLVFHATSLRGCHGRGDVVGHRAGLLIGLQPAWAQHAAEFAHALLHRFLGGDSHIKVRPALGDFLNQVIHAHLHRAGFLGGIGDGPGLTKYNDAHLLAGTVRQIHRATYLLVRLTGIHPQLERQFHRLAKLR